jgi:Iron-sulfur cluster-binding domain
VRPQRSCAENVHKALFVAADGEVSPCVYLNIPVEGVSYVSAGKEAPYQRLTFGRTSDECVEQIWAGREYARFRTALASADPVAECRDCPKRYSC